MTIYYILLIIFITAAAAGTVAAVLLENRFRRKLHRGLDSSDSMAEFKADWPPEKLLGRSRRMEKLAELWGKGVVIETGLAPLWADRLENNPGKTDLKRVLYHCPNEYACRAFLSALKNDNLIPLLENWLRETGPEQSLRLIARSCRGEDFDGTKAMKTLEPLFEGNPDAVIELTGASEWYIRYFAYRLILNRDEPKCRRAAWDGFMDTHPLIRRTLAEQYETPEREKLYQQLWKLLTEDPAFEVRNSSKHRILESFIDLYTPSGKALKGTAALRFLQLLKDESPDETNIAMDFLRNPDLELRYPAAVYLEKNGVLEKLLLNSSMEDREELARNYSLLKMALEVNVTSFLNKIDSSSNPGTLLSAAKLLQKGGDRRMLTLAAEAIFGFFKREDPGPEFTEIYTELLEGIKMRGDDSSLLQLKKELRERGSESKYLELLLPAIPSRADSIFLSILLDFFKTDSFPSREALLDSLETLPPELILPDLFKILDGDREEHSHTVRISALRLLGKFKLPFCLQCILENLPILPREEAGEFAAILNEYPKEEFEKKVSALFKTTDGHIRAALIRVLPAIDNRTFIKEIRGALKDTDPDVRIASIQALLKYGEIRLLNQETSMLRDPVERVRFATAEIIGEFGSPGAMTVLKGILQDINETTPVKKAAIAGLGASSTSDSLDLLISMLDEDSPFTEEIILALSKRKNKKDLTQLINNFREGTPALRESLTDVFKLQEDGAEPALLRILEDDQLSLQPYIAEILEGTGYIGKTIRKLSHRDIKVRRQAALWLSKLENSTSYRGLVLAARDPDQEIRILVVRALEKLNTVEGAEILDKLKNDPDRRIRKYTAWAMERLKALALD